MSEQLTSQLLSATGKGIIRRINLLNSQNGNVLLSACDRHPAPKGVAGVFSMHES
jgi:hypothetical protein